jgi:hypothetical protein
VNFTKVPLSCIWQSIADVNAARSEVGPNSPVARIYDVDAAAEKASAMEVTAAALEEICEGEKQWSPLCRPHGQALCSLRYTEDVVGSFCGTL